MLSQKKKKKEYDDMSSREHDLKDSKIAPPLVRNEMLSTVSENVNGYSIHTQGKI